MNRKIVCLFAACIGLAMVASMWTNAEAGDKTATLSLFNGTDMKGWALRGDAVGIRESENLQS